MLKTLRAIIKRDGSVELKEKINIVKETEALVTILDESNYDIFYVSERSLAKEWLLEDEEKAWKHLK